MSTYGCALSATPTPSGFMVVRVVDVALSFIAEEARSATPAFSMEVSERQDRFQLILMRARDTLIPHKRSCPIAPLASGLPLWTPVPTSDCGAHPDDPLLITVAFRLLHFDNATRV